MLILVMQGNQTFIDSEAIVSLNFIENKSGDIDEKYLVDIVLINGSYYTVGFNEVSGALKEQFLNLINGITDEEVIKCDSITFKK